MIIYEYVNNQIVYCTKELSIWTNDIQKRDSG